MKREEMILEADVVVLGGGLAGCNVAIGAAEQGARVVLFDKCKVRHSGNGGLGIDDHTVVHWDPEISPLSPAEYLEWVYSLDKGLIHPGLYKAFALQNYDTLKRLEGYGMPFTAPDGKYVFLSGSRKGGIWLKDSLNMKPILYERTRKAGVKMVETTMATNLLTQDGRVVGATGIDIRNEKFVICSAKATVLAAGNPMRFRDPIFNYCIPSDTGDGHAMAYRAGADLVNMEFIAFSVQPKNLRFMSSIGNVSHVVGPRAFVNWKGERLADKREKAKEGCRDVPWPPVWKEMMEGRGPVFINCADLPDDIMEVIEEHNRSEGRFAIDRWMQELGVSYRHSLIEVHVIERGLDPKYAGIYTDGNCATTVAGLYAVGQCMAGGAPGGRGAAIHCMTLGYHAGQQAARYAGKAPAPSAQKEQLDAERNRVYAPLKRKSWLRQAETHEAVKTIVNDYAGLTTRCEGNLTLGLEYLRRLREQSLLQAGAQNLHELLRLLELHNQIDLVEMNMLSALQRKESRMPPSHYRLDYPQVNDEEWLGKIVLVRRGREGMETEVKRPQYPKLAELLAEIKEQRL